MCRSGWVKPKYIYRHKTDKDIYRVEDNNATVDVTEDHSLFNDKQEKIKPSEISDETKLEYYKDEITPDGTMRWLNEKRARRLARWIKDGTLTEVPLPMLNSTNCPS